MTAAPIHSHNCTLPVVGAGEVVPPASLCHKESLRAALTGAISSAWLVLPSCPLIRVEQLLFQLLSSTARALTRLQCRHRQRDSEREAEWLVGLVAEKVPSSAHFLCCLFHTAAATRVAHARRHERRSLLSLFAPVAASSLFLPLDAFASRAAGGRSAAGVGTGRPMCRSSCRLGCVYGTGIPGAALL